MKVHSVAMTLAIACLIPCVAHAQEKKVTCADNTIVTSDAACANHGGVQKPGGLNRVGNEVKKAAIDVKDEAKRTPNNVEAAAKTTGKNVSNAGGDVSHGVKKTARKIKHGTGEVAGDVSKSAHKATHPRTYKANCNDGSTWTGRTKGDACKDHGGVSNWP